jgi:hypothetical protein
MIAKRIKNDEEVFDFVSSATRTMRAKVIAFAATCDRICADQIARNAGLRKSPRSAASSSSSATPLTRPGRAGRARRTA